MTAHLTSAGVTDLDSINANDIAYRAQIVVFGGAAGLGQYVVYTNTSYASYFAIDERNNSNNIWDSHCIFPPPPSGYSEQIWIYVTGGSQGDGNVQSYYEVKDRASAETYVTDVKYAQGWYGGDSFAMAGSQLATTTGSSHTPRDRGCNGGVKYSGTGGSSVLSSMVLEQKIYYT